MPKARTRTTKKTSRNPILSRNRGKGHGDGERLESVDLSDDTTTTESEVPTSPDSKETGTSPSYSPVSNQSSKSTRSKKSDKSASDRDIDEGLKTGRSGVASWESWPDLVSEMKLNGGTKVTYITGDLRQREFELNARKWLLQLNEELDMFKDAVSSSLKFIRSFGPEPNYAKVSDVIKQVGVSRTFSELASKLMALPTPSGYSTIAPRPYINIPEPLMEESEDDFNEDIQADQLQFQGNMGSIFPSSSKMSAKKYFTPNKQPNIFHFGTRSTNQGLSTSKAPRLPKPGEMVFSEGGSPILSRRIPDNVTANLTKPIERVEMIDADGRKFDVDLVFRGTYDANKLKEFKDFARDVRGIAATRSTSKQNKLQPPRINTKVSSASKKKPEWR